MTTPESKDVAKAVIALKEKNKNIKSNHDQFQKYMDQSQEILEEYLSLIDQYFNSTLQWVDLVDKLSQAIMDKDTSEEKNLQELFNAIDEFQEKTIDMDELNTRLTNITKLKEEFINLKKKLETSKTSVDNMIKNPGLVDDLQNKLETSTTNGESELVDDMGPLPKLDESRLHTISTPQQEALAEALRSGSINDQLQGGGKKKKLKKKLKHKLN
tara:strand:- start:435 stop:1076 length:642 start_codon:yes stop_codon:yes gene_type:complete